MDLGEFTAEITANIRRGSALDAVIPGFIRKAALWIERNKTLLYMTRFAEIDIDPEDENPRYVSLTGTRIKSIPMFRWVNDDGSFSYLTKRDPRDYQDLASGTPDGYWNDGVTRLVLSATPDVALHGELMVARYSAWPTTSTSTHWLIDNAEDVLEARTMINFANYARDAEVAAYWKNILDAGLVGLYAAEEEMDFENSDLVMGGLG